MLCVVVIDGMACLDNILYVVVHESSKIRLYNADTLSLLDVVIDVKGMIDPRDIVACRHDRQLYVAEDFCIWRVSADDHSYVKWRTTGSFRYKMALHMSLRSRRILLTTSRLPRDVHEYSTTNKELHAIELPQYVKTCHAADLTGHGTYIVSHTGTLQDERHYAVSELFRCCHVSE